MAQALLVKAQDIVDSLKARDIVDIESECDPLICREGASSPLRGRIEEGVPHDDRGHGAQFAAAPAWRGLRSADAIGNLLDGVAIQGHRESGGCDVDGSLDVLVGGLGR